MAANSISRQTPMQTRRSGRSSGQTCSAGETSSAADLPSPRASDRSSVRLRSTGLAYEREGAARRRAPSRRRVPTSGPSCLPGKTHRRLPEHISRTAPRSLPDVEFRRINGPKAILLGGHHAAAGVFGGCRWCGDRTVRGAGTATGQPRDGKGAWHRDTRRPGRKCQCVDRIGIRWITCRPIRPGAVKPVYAGISRTTSVNLPELIS